MFPRHLPSTTLLLAALSLTACAAQAEPAVAGADASGTAIAAQPVQPAADYGVLPVLAAKGDFASVRQLVAGKADPAFLADLQSWDTVQTKRADARHASFKAKIEELDKTVAGGEMEEALVDLIEAKILADDAKTFLVEPRSAGLVKKIEALAAKAEAEHDWVEAGTLYRLLNTLFDKTRPYLAQAKHVALHEQALALYNPKKLIALYKEQAKRTHALEKNLKNAHNGKKKKPLPDDEAAEEPEIETTPWQDRLKNITQRQLREVLFYAAKRHIDHHGYAELVEGALTGLDTAVSTEGLSDTLPMLADAGKVAQFRKELADLTAECRSKGKDLNLNGALGMLNQVQEINGHSVNLPENVLFYELGMGVTSRLDDFSNVIWPEQIAEFERMISGEFFGIGVQLSREPGELTVITPMEDTPAMRAGIRAGDVITHVNGKPTSTWTVDKAIKEITGPENTKVGLKLRRAGVDKPIEVELTRAKIEVDSIRGWAKTGDPAKGKWDYWLDKGQGIAYIRMSQFIQNSALDMDKAVAQAKSEAPIRALVLDLRYNPGGLLNVAADVADRFLDHGRIVSTVDAEGHENQLFSAGPGNEYGNFPVVVLVNEGSASASEILSGALQENHRVLVLGTNSFGKGSVQHIMPIARDTALFKLTIEHYALPSGRIIHREPNSKVWGIQPEFTVPMTHEEVRALVDAREEADLGQDFTPDNNRGPYTAQEILKEGLDPQVLAAKLYLETVLMAGKLSPAKAAAR